MKIASTGAALAFGLTVLSLPSAAQNVKITPVGSHPGELCANDRATLFEDPTGVRILYDTGQTVTGADDARLGMIHVVLFSHAHGDHHRRPEAESARRRHMRELGTGVGWAELHHRGSRGGEEGGHRR